MDYFPSMGEFALDIHTKQQQQQKISRIVIYEKRIC